MRADVGQQEQNRFPSAAERIENAEQGIPLLDEASFDTAALEHRGRMLVVFYLADCSACHALFVRLARLIPELQTPPPVFRVECRESAALAKGYHIENVPTLIAFTNDKESSRLEGLIPEQTLKQALGLER